MKEHEEIFKNCGKLIQTGLLPLYDLALDFSLINKIKEYFVNSSYSKVKSGEMGS